VTQQGAMRMTAIVLGLGFAATLLVGVPASAAPVPKHLMKEAEDTEEAKIQGRWKLEAIGIGGMPQQLDVTLEFRGTKMTGKSQDRAVSATIKLDITNGVKRLAMTNTQAVDGMGQLVKEEDVSFGYCIDGDKLTLATTLNGNGAVDPAKPGDNALVLVLTRVKEKN
jgi:uncharacterized protein (TIGR03067 family)